MFTFCLQTVVLQAVATRHLMVDVLELFMGVLLDGMPQHKDYT